MCYSFLAHWVFPRWACRPWDGELHDALPQPVSGLDYSQQSSCVDLPFAFSPLLWSPLVWSKSSTVALTLLYPNNPSISAWKGRLPFIPPLARIWLLFIWSPFMERLQEVGPGSAQPSPAIAAGRGPRCQVLWHCQSPPSLLPTPSFLFFLSLIRLN